MPTRSSLELMLDKLQNLEDQPDDGPPALPTRPVSRARLPRPRTPFQLCGMKGDSWKINGIGLSENLKEMAEMGIIKIQKWFRGYLIRCYYRELRTTTLVLQSFVRGENARRVHGHIRNATLWAVIIIQKQTRKHFKHKLHQSGDRGCSDRRLTTRELEYDQTRVAYSVLVDLQRQVVNSEAKVRGKSEENLGLTRKIEEIEKKWRLYEERMRSMEKEWQDQFTYIQECLADSKNKDGKFEISCVYGQEMMNGGEEVRVEVRPGDEIRKLMQRFKAWKKEYKCKLRDAQSALRKLGSTQSEKKGHWWRRL